VAVITLSVITRGGQEAQQSDSPGGYFSVLP
jgi:hypothetical protein